MRKIAIVTGASRGIGRTIALRLAADGFGVVVNYAGNAAKAEEVVNEITSSGGRALAVQADVANPEKVKKLQTMAKRKKLAFYAISAVSGVGVEALKYAIGKEVHEQREREIELREKPEEAALLG